MDAVLRLDPRAGNLPVSKSIPDYLKLHTEPAPAVAPPAARDVPGLAELCTAFEQTTGWRLRYTRLDQPAAGEAVWSSPVPAGSRNPQGQLRMEPGLEPALRIDMAQSAALAGGVADLLSELLKTEHALWRREAELAAGVPIVARASRAGHLAGLLESLLRGAAEAIDCQAAGLYLLDEATTELKLRASWNLPRSRLTAPPRTLADAAADLEAMAGHAVALEDMPLARHWNPPEEHASAICLPVSSAESILGTLWLFCEEPRQFTDKQANLAEIVAGRLATELEREMLAVEALHATEMKKDLAAAEQFQREQLPNIAPHCAGWDVAGWSSPARQVGGDFHDWFPVADDRLAFALADVCDRGTRAALVGGGLRAALRAHGEYGDHLGRLLEKVNRGLWSGAAGNQLAALVCGILEPDTGLVRYAWAGCPLVLHLRRGAATRLTQPRVPLGLEPEAAFAEQLVTLAPGESLAMFSDGLLAASDANGIVLGESGLTEMLLGRIGTPSSALVDLIRRRLVSPATDATASASTAEDRSLLIVRRLP